MAIKLNHIAIVTADFEGAVRFWQDVIGLPLTTTENNQKEAVRVGFLATENSEIELIAPTTDNSGVANYLQKYGAGLHHLCLEVDNIDATLEDLRSKDIELINETPKTKYGGVRYAFAHPRSTGGVMIEFYELPKE